MVKRSEWEESVLTTYDAELCGKCGRYVSACHVDPRGWVYAYCPTCNREWRCAKEGPPSSLDPEDPGDSLPF
jgi:hypothetical protein